MELLRRLFGFFLLVFFTGFSPASAMLQSSQQSNLPQSSVELPRKKGPKLKDEYFKDWKKSFSATSDLLAKQGFLPYEAYTEIFNDLVDSGRNRKEVNSLIKEWLKKKIGEDPQWIREACLEKTDEKNKKNEDRQTLSNWELPSLTPKQLASIEFNPKNQIFPLFYEPLFRLYELSLMDLEKQRDKLDPLGQPQVVFFDFKKVPTLASQWISRKYSSNDLFYAYVGSNLQLAPQQFLSMNQAPILFALKSLEKFLDQQSSNYYFGTGTWIREIKFTGIKACMEPVGTLLDSLYPAYQYLRSNSGKLSLENNQKNFFNQLYAPEFLIKQGLGTFGIDVNDFQTQDQEQYLIGVRGKHHNEYCQNKLTITAAESALVSSVGDLLSHTNGLEEFSLSHSGVGELYMSWASALKQLSIHNANSLKSLGLSYNDFTPRHLAPLLEEYVLGVFKSLNALELKGVNFNSSSVEEIDRFNCVLNKIASNSKPFRGLALSGSQLPLIFLKNLELNLFQHLGSLKLARVIQHLSGKERKAAVEILSRWFGQDNFRKEIQLLDLSHNGFSDREFFDIFKFDSEFGLRKFEKLVTLRLSGNHIGMNAVDERLNEICRSSPFLQTLELLDVNEVQNGDEEELLKAVSEINHIRRKNGQPLLRVVLDYSSKSNPLESVD